MAPNPNIQPDHIGPRPPCGTEAYWMSSDRTVTAMLDVDDGCIVILEWSSFAPGQGNTNKALAELKNEGKHIHANGIGYEPSDKSWQYWIHMMDKGLVDTAESDEGEYLRGNA